MKKLNIALKACICFWVWVGTMLLALLLAILAASPVVVPQIAVCIIAVVIVAALLTVLIINPGIFAKQHTACTGK